MPLSRKRKKKGKKVRGHGVNIKIDPNKESAVSIQDLIDVVAYQDYVKDGTIVPGQTKELQPTGEVGEFWGRVRTSDDAEIAPGVILRSDAVINIPNSVPVNLEDERGNKIGVGTASPIEGDPDHVSIEITDPRVLRMIQAPVEHVSIDKENQDER